MAFSKPTVPQKGDSRFLVWRLLASHFWDLLVLNLLYALCFLPLAGGTLLILTGRQALGCLLFFAGGTLLTTPAGKGMARTVRDMAQTRCYEPYRGFFRAFCEEYGRTLGFGSAVHLPATALVFGLMRAASTAQILLCAVALLFLLLAGCYGFFLLANIELSLPAVLKNAVLLCFADAKSSAYILLGLLVGTGACLLAVPYTLALIPLCLFSFLWLFCGLPAWHTVLTFVVPSGDTEPEE